MPIPVIQPISSVFGYRRYQAFQFQFVATNSPTSWTCSPIASGLYFDTNIGRIGGAAIYPGVFPFYVTATNASGTSVPQLFVMGIEDALVTSPSCMTEVVFDVGTRQVTRSGAQPTASDKPAELVAIKYGDDLLLNVICAKFGVRYVPTLVSLKLAIKEYEPERIVLQSTSFASYGAGDNASYVVHVKLENSALKSILSNYEDDTATEVVVLAELEMVETNPTVPLVGPATIRTTSLTFRIRIPRDIIPNV